MGSRTQSLTGAGRLSDGQTNISDFNFKLKMPAKDQGFTEDQVEDFKEVFQLFDTKGDGLIQVNQVGEVLRALGTNPTEGEVKKLVQSTVSVDGPDTRVTFETFLPMLQDVSSKPIRDTVDDFVEGLKHFDKEGNGLISAVELRHLLTGLGEKMSEEEVELLIHGKEDSQGNINYEEFVRWFLPSKLQSPLELRSQASLHSSQMSQMSKE